MLLLTDTVARELVLKTGVGSSRHLATCLIPNHQSSQKCIGNTHAFRCEVGNESNTFPHIGHDTLLVVVPALALVLLEGKRLTSVSGLLLLLLPPLPELLPVLKTSLPLSLSLSHSPPLLLEALPLILWLRIPAGKPVT